MSDGAPPARHDDDRRPARMRWLQRAWRAAPWILAALVLALVGHQAWTIDWRAVGTALRAHSPGTVALATLVGLASHALYASFDLLSRAVLRHGLGIRRTVLIALTSYAFNLNFGALVGGMALRLRLYAAQGVATPVAAEVIAWSLATNWLGYGLLGGTVLLLAPPAVPADWLVTGDGWRLVGGALLLLALAWLAACAAWPGRQWHWRRLRMRLPPGPVALLQALLSTANWLAIATVIWLLLDRQAGFTTTLAVLQLAAVAGVITHVPAGLGVLEAVFLAMLAPRIPAHQVLAALLAYRACYYLLPLAWAIPTYFAGEARRRA